MIIFSSKTEESAGRGVGQELLRMAFVMMYYLAILESVCKWVLWICTTM